MRYLGGDYFGNTAMDGFKLHVQSATNGFGARPETTGRRFQRNACSIQGIRGPQARREKSHFIHQS